MYSTLKSHNISQIVGMVVIAAIIAGYSAYMYMIPQILITQIKDAVLAMDTIFLRN